MARAWGAWAVAALLVGCGTEESQPAPQHAAGTGGGGGSSGSGGTVAGAPSTGGSAQGGAGGVAGNAAGGTAGVGGAAGTAGTSSACDETLVGSIDGTPVSAGGPSLSLYSTVNSHEWSVIHFGGYHAFAWGPDQVPLPHGIGHVSGPGGRQYCADATSLSADLQFAPGFTADIHYAGFTSLGSCDDLNGQTYTVDICTTDLGGAPTASCPSGQFAIQGQVGQLPIDVRAFEGASYWEYNGSTWQSTAMILDGYGIVDATSNSGVLRLDFPFDSVYCVASATDLSSAQVRHLKLEVRKLGQCPADTSVAGDLDGCVTF
ncbi:MAG: hypothetical protein KC492_45230 [Myxococcales bacterium]|nr:hypothetical protein [Myxococcales bacterium]MCB9609186.1 hypothetical protein [Polyangiaceae bacterium]